MKLFASAGQAWRRFRALLRVVRADPLLRFLFLSLLAIDSGWILWFAITKLLYYLELNSYLYKQLKHLRITTEGGWPEFFNYAQTLALVLLLVRLTWSHRRLIYLAMTAVFAVVLLDDSLAIHEAWGGLFVRSFGIPDAFGLYAQGIGELIAWTILGACVVPLVLAGLARAEFPHRDNGLALLLPFAVLLFCAIFVDQLYASFGYAFFGSSILLDSIEDGGEMLAITTACALAATLVRHGPDVASNAPEHDDS